MRVYCRNCDLMFESLAFGAGVPMGAVVGCTESCPRCGQQAEIENSIGGVPQGFRLIRDAQDALAHSSIVELRALHTVAQSVAVGRQTAEAGAREAAELREVFAKLIVFAKEWGLLHLLVAIIGIYISWAVTQEGNDKSSDELLLELRRSNEIAAEALDELRRIDGSGGSRPPAELEPPTLLPIQRTSIAPVQPNRHARRSAQSKRKRGRGPTRL